MSHWYRAPRAVSVRHLISRSGEGLVFDRAIDGPTEMLQVLSRNVPYSRGVRARGETFSQGDCKILPGNS
jgi:hypothetical protein